MSDGPRDTWSLAQSFEEGAPVIWKMPLDPSPEVRSRFPWLTVISWKYNGENDGMPSERENQKMMALEHALQSGLEAEAVAMQFATRTGNGLKELRYYSAEQNAFIGRLNDVLRTHERYPIEIGFYHDPDWQEHANLIAEILK
jgi:Family of unknown function (DUF695)